MSIGRELARVFLGVEEVARYYLITIVSRRHIVLFRPMSALYAAGHLDTCTAMPARQEAVQAGHLDAANPWPI